MARFRGGDMRFPACYFLGLVFAIFAASFSSVANAGVTHTSTAGRCFNTYKEFCQFKHPNGLTTSSGTLPDYQYFDTGCVFGSPTSIGTSRFNYLSGMSNCNVSCPVGESRDPITGLCVAPVPPGPVECAQNWTGGEMVYSESLDQCVKYPNLPPPEFCSYMAGKDSPRKRHVSHGDASGPTSVAEVGTFCVLQVTDAKCVVGVDGVYDCVVSGKYTGDYDDTATDAPGHCTTMDCETVPAPDPEPKPDTITESKPCVYSSSGNKQVCTSSSSQEKQGTADCGVVNGVSTCVTKQPTKNGIDITTEVTTEPTPDGGTKTTKTDVATVTECSGVGSCTTSTTTSVTVSRKDGAGNDLGTSVSCTGPACKSGQGGSADGTGDGTGICANGDCSEEAGSQGPGCVGDGCVFVGPEGLGDDVPTFSQSFQSMYAGVMSSPIAQAVTSIDFPSGGVAPSGEVVLFGDPISFDTYIDLWLQVAPILSAVFLAVWCLLGIRIFLSA